MMERKQLQESLPVAPQRERAATAREAEALESVHTDGKCRMCQAPQGSRIQP